jgi:hypothetical protein
MCTPMCEVRAYVTLRCYCQVFAPRVKPERTPSKPPIQGRLASGIAAGPSRSPLPKAPPAAPLVLSPSITPAGLTRVARERKATQRMLVRQAGCPNRSPGGDRATQHQGSLYRDWRRRGQMVMSIVVGNVGIRNMFYHTNFGGEGCDHFRK